MEQLIYSDIISRISIATIRFPCYFVTIRAKQQWRTQRHMRFHLGTHLTRRYVACSPLCLLYFHINKLSFRFNCHKQHYIKLILIEFVLHQRLVLSPMGMRDIYGFSQKIKGCRTKKKQQSCLKVVVEQQGERLQQEYIRCCHEYNMQNYDFSSSFCV